GCLRRAIRLHAGGGRAGEHRPARLRAVARTAKMRRETMSDIDARLWRWLPMVAAWWLLAIPGARADDCSASMTDMDFGQVSPIANSDYTARGTLTVTCYWTLLGGRSALLLPAANFCVNLGPGGGGGSGDPRWMING